jgi:hypothetical protein
MTAADFPPDHDKRTAWFLALAGFLPFAILSLALLATGKTGPMHGLFIDAFRTWSAIILSFLGGIRWGAALAARPIDRLAIGFSVFPAIVGWFALFLPAPYGIPVLLVAFCAQGAWDSISIHAGKGPAWFASIRITLTLMVAAAHLVALLAVL